MKPPYEAPHATDFLRVDKRMLLTELFRAFDDLVSGKFTPCVDMACGELLAESSRSTGLYDVDDVP